MWVVWNHDTGYSDESMRFASRAEANQYIQDAMREDENAIFGLRFEA